MPEPVAFYLYERADALKTAIDVGQRWASEMEPELGVGIVEAIAGRQIHLRFPKSGITRIYAI